MPDQTKTPYVTALLEFARSDPGRYNVPGHQGGVGADAALRSLAGQAGLADDIPALIEGIDVGDDNPFQAAQDLAAEAWGAKRTWFLVNGASQGNQTMCLAVAHMGQDVVIQRNVHSSVIDGMIMAGLNPTFAAPELDPDLGVAHCLTPAELEEALDRCPDAADPACAGGQPAQRFHRAGAGRYRPRGAGGRYQCCQAGAARRSRPVAPATLRRRRSAHNRRVSAGTRPRRGWPPSAPDGAARCCD